MDTKVCVFLTILLIIFNLIVLLTYKCERIPLKLLTHIQSTNSRETAPLQRAYLNVVRDTVSGLTLRTREHKVVSTPNGSYTIVPLVINQRINGHDWPAIGISM